MATAKSWIQEDFSGGQNDLIPAEQIAKNEVVSLVNLLPGDSGQPLTVRGGAALVCDLALGAGKVLDSIYNYRRTSAAELGSSFYLTSDGSSVYRITDFALGTTVKCFDWTTPGHTTHFVTFLNRVFAMNGVDDTMVWDGTSTAWLAVADRDGTYPSPKLRYAMPFRGRLWGIGSDGNVWFSGSGDEEEILPATNPKTYYQRYQVWSGTLDSDGGSDNVGDDSGQHTTAIASLYNGMVIFKERMTYLWSWGQDDHPHESSASSIDVLVPGVGCAAQETVQYSDGSILFLGQNAASDYAIYRLSGQGIDDVAIKIPIALKRVVAASTSRPRSAIHDNYYLLAADDYDGAGASRTLVFALDLKRKCWLEISGWNIGGMTYSVERDKLLIASGADSTLRQYPDGHVDGTNTPIDWLIKTMIIDGGNPLEDHRWRMGFVDVLGVDGDISLGVSLDGDEVIEHSRIFTISGIDYWEPDSYWVDGLGFDGSLWDDGSNWYSGSVESRIAVDMPYRSRTLQYVVTGSSSDGLSIKRLAAVFRQRKLGLT